MNKFIGLKGHLNFWILLLVLGVIFFIFLGYFPLEVPDSARYAEIPREMIVRHDFITPYLNGLKYFEKPPLFYWLQVVSFKSFGINDFAAHLPNAALALMICLLNYFVGKKFYDEKIGIAASLVLATSSLFFALGRIVTLDIAFTFFLSLSLFSFLLGSESPYPATKRHYFWAMYICAALATMTKGLIGIVFPGMIVFCWLLLTGRWRELKTYRLLDGIIIFAIVAAPWHILVQSRNPEFAHFYFIEQHFLRFATPYASREQPFWYFPALFLGGLFPWLVFLMPTIKKIWPHNRFDIKSKSYV